METSAVTRHLPLAAAVAIACAFPLAGCHRDPNQQAARHTARADAYLARHQLPEAIIEYGNALKATPEATAVHYKLARVYESSGDIAKAYQEYARTADLDPSNLDAQMRAGNILLGAGEFQLARTRAELALKAHPNHVPALILLGNASAGLKDTVSALRQVQQAIDLDPSSAPAWSALGAVKFLGGRHAEAGAAFRKAVELAPRSVDAQLALASYQWAQGNAAEAEATLKRAVSLDGSNPAAHRALALLYLSQRRAPEAEPHFRALATDAEGRLALADYYAALDKQSEALQILGELEHDSDKATVRAARLREAGVLYARGDKAQAHRLIDELLAEHGRRNVDARLAKARMLLAEGTIGDAVTQAKEAVKADGGNPATQYTLGLALLASKDFAGAERAFQEVTRLNPRAAAAQMQLARLRLARGDPASAVTAAEAAVQAGPRDVEAAVMLSQSLRANGQYERASRQVQESLASAPDAAPLLLEQGSLALQRRDAAGARVAFTHALGRDPASFEAKQGLVAADLAERKADHARALVVSWRKSSPADMRLRVLGARIDMAAGELASAAETLSAVVAEDPSQLDAYQLLGSIYAAQGKTADAVAQYQRIAERSPGAAAGARTMVGMLKESQNDRAGAREVYQQVVDADPNAAVAANNLAWIYAEDGKLDDALRLALAARDAMGRRPEGEDTLGWVYLQKGLAVEALASFERALQRAPERAVYHYHAGLAHLKAGDKARARLAFKKALDLDKAFAGSADARKQLESLQ
jgi:tetratricopeptide (TPR) repeat protein